MVVVVVVVVVNLQSDGLGVEQIFACADLESNNIDIPKTIQSALCIHIHIVVGIMQTGGYSDQAHTSHASKSLPQRARHCFSFSLAMMCAIDCNARYHMNTVYQYKCSVPIYMKTSYLIRQI